ncbi:MAG TPA: cytochrome c peroxidase, partial [Chitinophagales bacterium]
TKFFINGPLVPKYDFEMGQKIFEPNGFQRIEELLFDEKIDTAELHKVAQTLHSRLSYSVSYFRTVRLTDAQLLEAIQLQLFRISSMNISGYDCTISLENITETVSAVDGLQQAFQSFEHYTNDNASESSATNAEAKKLYAQFQKQLIDAKKYLKKNPDYNSFDRLFFITNHINELTKTIVAFRKAIKLPQINSLKAININEPFMFGQEALNMRYFALYNDTNNLKTQMELGKKIFYDSILSNTGNKSCASCHIPAKAFADGLRVGKGTNDMELPRNTPTLYNVSLQKLFFFDGRANNMELQAFEVIHNKDEIGGNLEDAAKRMKADSTYVRMFQTAFPNTVNAQITSYGIMKAITEYERTLLSLDSRFDQYIRGDKTALNAREINGYNLFAGKALCGSCHFFPLFNGTIPPRFKDTEFEVLGVPKSADNKKLDDDIGREKTVPFKELNRAFKTPTLRNIALTAPYMHNGCYNTLEEVMDFYIKGGGVGFGFDVPNQTLPFDSLQLSQTEKEDIIFFMKSLSGKEANTSMINY